MVERPGICRASRAFTLRFELAADQADCGVDAVRRALASRNVFRILDLTVAILNRVDFDRVDRRIAGVRRPTNLELAVLFAGLNVDDRSGPGPGADETRAAVTRRRDANLDLVAALVDRQASEVLRGTRRKMLGARHNDLRSMVAQG